MNLLKILICQLKNKWPLQKRHMKRGLCRKIPSKTFVSDQSLKNECLYSPTTGKIYFIIAVKKMELGRNSYAAFQLVQSI